MDTAIARNYVCHLILGWEGNEDAWYNLQDIVAGGHQLSPVGSVLQHFP
jgi:hypothetical protein